MAKFDKLAVMQKIGETGMVPVFYHSNAETAKKKSSRLATTVACVHLNLPTVAILPRKCLPNA